MRIALDAMGSDHFPSPDVDGAVQAAREYGDTIILVGDEAIIKAELQKHDTQGLQLEVVHTSEHVEHTDTPSKVGRAKPNSSMHIASRMVKEGTADACVSAGNTGAALAITTLYTLGRIRGVKRPMLTAIATVRGKPVVLADIGANADCKPEWLAQFAMMGSIYSEKTFNNPSPKVGLLSNGEEEGKGNDVIREAAALIRELPINFVGNVEPKEVLSGTDVDVMICDGLIGNVFIKTMEAFGSLLFGLLREELTSDTRSKLSGALGRPAFRRVYKQVDPFEIGGTILIGLSGVMVIAHGRTNALGIKNSIRQAREAVQGKVVQAIQENLVVNSSVENE
jgi:glycerol-3-phosphate acyltransferase PlsX